jgi:hypothetical protein
MVCTRGPPIGEFVVAAVALGTGIALRFDAPVPPRTGTPTAAEFRPLESALDCVPVRGGLRSPARSDLAGVFRTGAAPASAGSVPACAERALACAERALAGARRSSGAAADREVNMTHPSANTAYKMGDNGEDIVRTSMALGRLICQAAASRIGLPLAGPLLA